MLDIFGGICTTPQSKIKWSTPYIFTFGDAKIGFFLATKYMFLKLPVYLTQPCCVFTLLISHIVPT